MKLSLHLDVYLEDTISNHAGTPEERDDRVLDEDTSGKAKFTVSTTGISRVMLENIKKRLTAIGGAYSETLDLSVTHLIARKLGSEKTNFASKYDIPMVKQRWLQICFENGRLMPVTGCRFKPLESFSICVSGSNGIDRAELERRVTMLGGIYKAIARRWQNNPFVSIATTRESRKI